MRYSSNVLAGISAAAIFAAVSLPAAHATGFTLGAFDQFGLLVNNDTANGDINTSPVNANIGIGTIDGTINLHHIVINGGVYCAGTCATVVHTDNPGPTGTQPVSLGGSPSPFAFHSNYAAVEVAITQAISLSSTYGADASLGKSITISSSQFSGSVHTITINASAGNLVNGVRLFTATSFSIGNGNTYVINGTTSDYVVIDVTGSSNNKLDGALTLTGGITADHVLINFTGSGSNLQGAANGATLEATFLVPNLTVQLNSLVIDGHLFGGQGDKDFQFVSNALIVQPPLGVPGPVTGSGLPGLVLAGGGLFAWWRRRMKREPYPR